MPVHSAWRSNAVGLSPGGGSMSPSVKSMVSKRLSCWVEDDGRVANVTVSGDG